MPRPKKPAETQRTKQLNCRVTEDEFATIQARTAQTKMTQSDYVRHMAVNGNLVIKENSTFPPELIYQLNRIGTNLNQLTRVANATGEIPPDLSATLKRINELLNKAID